MIVSQSEWKVVRVTGADRIRFMQGMCMGNIESLGEGGWIRTATLDVKGRLRTIYDLVRRPDDLLLVCQPGLAEQTCDILAKHAIMDDVVFEVTDLAVHRHWPDPRSVWTAPPLFDAPDGQPATAEQAEVRRIEAGLPLFGVDVDDKNFPFETPLADLIDYKKGCYIGQEPVARVYSRGEPSKRMRGLRLEGEGPAEVGAVIDHPAKDRAGRVTSSAVSPQFGPIALGFLARGAWDAGCTVSVAGRSAAVTELPFAD